MLMRPLLTTFVLGCALGVATTLLLKRHPTPAEPDGVKPVEVQSREVAALPEFEMPDDLSLQEIYDRVSFVS